MKIQLHGLNPGWTYALRVAAVNSQGRAWSNAIIFQTLAGVRCTEREYWKSLFDDNEFHHLCGPDFHPSKLLGVVASPPCTTFSNYDGNRKIHIRSAPPPARQTCKIEHGKAT